MSLPVCNIRFCKRAPASWILAGYKLLEDEHVLKIKHVEVYNDFYVDNIFQHASIVEVEINNKIIVYDYSNGYQSFLRDELFDKQLDRVHAYFKTNLDLEKHKHLRNAYKIHPFIAGYFSCTCKGNPYDFTFNKAKPYDMNNLLSNTKAIIKAILRKQNNDYRNYESFNTGYNDYKFLFWTRINPTEISLEETKSVYSFLSDEEAKIVAEKWQEMLEWVNDQRISVFKELKNNFGDKLIGGIEDNEYARYRCPDLITHDERISTRASYSATMKENVVGIITKGHQYCVGARCGELLAAGRAMLSDTFSYVMPYDFKSGKNYIEFECYKDVCDKAEKMITDIDLIHSLEQNNRTYYLEHFRPQSAIRDSLKVAFPDVF